MVAVRDSSDIRLVKRIVVFFDWCVPFSRWLLYRLNNLFLLLNKSILVNLDIDAVTYNTSDGNQGQNGADNSYHCGLLAIVADGAGALNRVHRRNVCLDNWCDHCFSSISGVGARPISLCVHIG